MTTLGKPKLNNSRALSISDCAQFRFAEFWDTCIPMGECRERPMKPWHGKNDRPWVTVTGYGNVGASRVAFVAVNGNIPAGWSVLHHCDNPRCVNPDHLFLGTHRDNMADMSRKYRKRKAGLDQEASKW